MVVLLVGCVAPIEVEARFEDTRTACGLAPVPLDAEVYLRPPSLDDCRDLVLADLGADEASLAAAGTLDALLAAAAALLAIDLGGVDELPDGPLADALGEVAAETGGDELAGLLYDYAASRFTATVGADDDEAHASVDTGSGVLRWSERTAAGLDGAALLVHEARHRDGHHHVACADGEVVCDEGDDGAWGLQLAVHEAALAATEDELVGSAEEAWIAVVAESIHD